METEKSNQKIGKILMISILVIMLLSFIFLFFNSFKMEYKSYKETKTIFNELHKNESDSQIMIRIDTEDGIFLIDNIISNYALFNEIETTFSNGDEIVINYYKTNRVLGIKKGENIVLNVTNSIEKLTKNDKLSLVIFPVMFLVSIGGIIYTI